MRVSASVRPHRVGRSRAEHFTFSKSFSLIVTVKCPTLLGVDVSMTVPSFSTINLFDSFDELTH